MLITGLCRARRAAQGPVYGYHTAMTQTDAEPNSSSASEHIEPLLDVRGLKTYFPIRSGLLQRVTDHFKAVDDVSFKIGKGETLGLVGESGCGKTTVGRTLLRLVPATAGTVTFEGHNMFTASGSELQKLRSDMQIVFQDPAGSLNPRMRIASIVGEPMIIHGMVTDKAELRERVE